MPHSHIRSDSGPASMPVARPTISAWPRPQIPPDPGPETSTYQVYIKSLRNPAKRRRGSLSEVAELSSGGDDHCLGDKSDTSCRFCQVSRRGELRPPALVEPCVTLSRHTAPVAQPMG